MSRKLSITDLPIKGKRVLVRVDFNVPLDKNGVVVDDSRIAATLPTIRYILEQGGSVILMSHLGRPKGKRSPEFSLAPCAKRLEKLLGGPVIFASDCVGPEVKKTVERLKPGEVLLLENLRFHKGEEKPAEEPEFAQQLVELGDVYVNDAFGTAHREHASTFTVPQLMKGKAAAGFLLEKEIRFLEPLTQNPERPFAAIIGGSKISTKIGILKSLLDKVDMLFIGGGMSYTFYRAQGIEVGDSIVEEDLIPEAAAIMAQAKQRNVKFYLPLDNVVAEALEEDSATQIVDTADGIPPGEIGVDIGPETVDYYVTQLRQAKTVFWNGPLGIYEIGPFGEGTNDIARALAEMTGEGVTTIIGGGDSAAAIKHLGYTDHITHISTGGGAAMEYIEYGKLPGIDVLSIES